MDITIMGRNVGITDRFKEYATEKSDRVEHLAPRALALEVRLCRHHETNGTTGDDRVELTLIGPGPVVRAEAAGVDKYAAYDAALGKLLERVRRAKDRKKVHRGHGNRMTSLREAALADFSTLDVVPADAQTFARVQGAFDSSADTAGGQRDAAIDGDESEDYSPMVIRHKTFEAAPMTLDDAMYRMELVGHDFYLFVDAETLRPCVVYRRKGWDYGVITVNEPAAEPAAEHDTARQEALAAV